PVPLDGDHPDQQGMSVGGLGFELLPRLGIEPRRELTEVHLEDHLLTMETVGLLGGDGHTGTLSDIKAENGLVEPLEQLAAADGKFQGVALPRGVENRAVGESAGVVNFN